MKELNLKEKKQIAEDRLIQLLNFSLGEIVPYLQDKDVVEVMLNPDKKVWVDTLSKGMFFTGITVEPHNSERTIHSIATYVDKIADYKEPIVTAELPESGSRFEGLLPPIVNNPTFTIRKKGIKVFTLDDYVNNGNLNEKQKQIIIEKIKDRKNILVVGGTSTGKTTFTNAIINEISLLCQNERLVIMEDTEELQSNSENTCRMKTSAFVTMRDLLKSTMRLRPDRIIVGEIRDGAGLDLITAWNSGHPGGISTIHSESAIGGLRQLEQYIQRVSVSKQEELIGGTVNIIIVLERTVDAETGKVKRSIKGIYENLGFKNGEYQINKIDK